MPIDDNEGKASLGFSGLNNLVSDVSTDIDAPSQKPPKKEVTNLSGIILQHTPVAQESQSSSQKNYPYGSMPGNDGSSYLIKICYAVIGIILVGIFLNMCSTSSTTTQTNVTSLNDWHQNVKIEKPPIGNNLLLNTSQIRYCLADKIRIESIRTITADVSDALIKKFNFLVDDYNSRCGQFRYRNKEFEYARQEVERYRSQIAETAKSKWLLEAK